MPRFVTALTLSLPLLGWSEDASAQGLNFAEGPPYSIDIEFFRPQFGNGGFAGVDTPMVNRNLTVRVGTLVQYEAAPLTLYEAVQNAELGTVVSNRVHTHVGASLDVERVSVSVVAPFAGSWNSDETQEQFAAPGLAMGDVGAGLKVVVVQTPRNLFNLGVRGGIVLPTGTRNAYQGEGELRGTTGLLAAVNVGQLTVATDFGFMLRDTKITSEDFVAANEVVWTNGVRYKLPDASHLGLNAQLLSRSVLDEFLNGGAENALEAVGGVEFYPSRRTTITLGAGRGLTEGYGTTDYRMLGSLVVEVPPPEPLPPRYAITAPPPPEFVEPPPEIIEEPPPPEEWKPEELAKVIGNQIFIRDMVEFKVDTNILLDKSRPTLEEVARLINADKDSWTIGHLIIEGHASKEGSTDHNYELAESRARRIWEVLMELGVAKERISYRGMGEVQPLPNATAEDEESYQKNRRVEFHIVQRFETVDQAPKYPANQILPWNEAVVSVVTPPRPEPPKVEEPKGPKLDEFGLPIDEEEEGGVEPGGDTGGGK
jgi:outer membrane protein OmpA-like peptidoglycan-associated protein